MSNKGLVIEKRSLVPATCGALVAVLMVTAFGLFLLFYVNPPDVELVYGKVELDLSNIVGYFHDFFVGYNCAYGLQKLIGIGCRLESLAAISNLILSSSSASISALAIFLGAGAAGSVSFVKILQQTPNRENVKTIRGWRPFFDADGRRHLRALIATTGRSQHNNLWLAPHVQLTPATESYNVLAVGTQGSGKTSILRALIEQIIARNDQLFVHDAKGDMTAGIPVKGAILVAPHDERSWAYDIAADIRNRQHAREFAAHAIPISDHDPMWGKGAQGIWADLVMALAVETGGRWTWVDLAEQLLRPGVEIQAILERHGAGNASKLIFGNVDPEENRTTMSLLITLWVAAITIVLPLAEAWANVPEHRQFSLRAWVRSKGDHPKTIIFQRSSEYPTLSAALGGFLVDRLAGLAMNPDRSRNSTNRLALCLDELPELGKLERLPNLLNVGREFGLVTFAGLQDFAHLADVYGENKAEVLLARFRIKLIHQLDPGDTANRVSKLLGHRTVEYLKCNNVGSERAQYSMERETVAVFETDRLESELGIKMKGSQIEARIMILGLGNPVIVKRPSDRMAGSQAKP